MLIIISEACKAPPPDYGNIDPPPEIVRPPYKLIPHGEIDE